MAHALRALCTQCGLITPLGCPECGPGVDHGTTPSPCFEALEAMLKGEVAAPDQFDCRTCLVRFKAVPPPGANFPMQARPSVIDDDDHQDGLRATG